MDDEAFWSSDPTVLRDSEWAKISSDFTNAGYREGITAGKESALQQGFDEGFAQVGAPIGRELGILRGLCSALIAFLSRPQGTAPSPDSTLSEVREIAKQLAEVRFSDIAPPDLEALAHAKEHLGGAAMDADADEDAADLTDPAKLNEEIKEKRDMEGLEDLMAQMNADGGSGSAVQTRPKAEDVARLKERLLAIAQSKFKQTLERREKTRWFFAWHRSPQKEKAAERSRREVPRSPRIDGRIPEESQSPNPPKQLRRKKIITLEGRLAS